MTKAIIQAHSGSVNFIIALFSFVRGIDIFPFTVFNCQIISQEKLFDHFYAGNKVCRGYHAIFFSKILFDKPVSRRFK